MQFKRARYAGAEEEALRAALTGEQYVAHLKLHSDARRNVSGYHGVGRRESGRWQARKSSLPVRTPLDCDVRYCAATWELAAWPCCASLRCTGAGVVL